MDLRSMTHSKVDGFVLHFLSRDLKVIDFYSSFILKNLQISMFLTEYLREY